jgi:hypothetical protein
MHDPRVITPIPPDLLQAVDEFRYTNRLASRAEAVRRLLKAGVGQEQAKVETPSFLKQQGIWAVFTETIIRDLRKIRLAQDAVRPFVGEVGDCDSEGAVYRKALKALGHDVRALNGAAAAAIWPTVRHQPRKAASLAMDTRQADAYRTRFPGAFSLKSR